MADGDATRDPGLSAAVPFRFACHRCGHCCTGGAGFVWVEDDELPALAAAKGMDGDDFVRTFVKRVRDPKTGRMRLSLRERETGGSGGPCALLEGTNQCSVYTARPRHCADFPYWPAVLEDPAAFERARAVCPGIAVEAEPAQREEAFRLLRELFAEVDACVNDAQPVCTMRGVCCRFEEAGHELYSTALEADYAADCHPDAPPPEAPGRCPYHQNGLCTAREGRPLGCRTYFCDEHTETVLQDAHERFLRRIREIERDCGYPVAYGRFPALLEARGIGTTREPA